MKNGLDMLFFVALIVWFLVSTIYKIYHPSEAYRNFQAELETKGILSKIEDALDVYQSNCGLYPTTESNVVKFLRQTPLTSHDEPVSVDCFHDAWGNRIIYRNDGTNVCLVSVGLDGILNTDDDIERQISPKTSVRIRWASEKKE